MHQFKNIGIFCVSLLVLVACAPTEQPESLPVMDAPTADITVHTGTAVHLSSSHTTVTERDVLTVTAEIENATDVYAYQMNLSYDPAVVEFQSVEPGNFLSQGQPDSTFFVAPQTDEPGHITAAAETLLGDAVREGSGALTVFTFQAVAAGDPMVRLTDLSLIDTSANTIPVEIR